MDSITGIVPPMVTPLADLETLDYKGLEKLIEHLVAGGVHGIFILGTTGEGPSLSHPLRVELIKQVCAQVDGRIPVLVGITDTSFSESVYIANRSDEYGVQAVVLAPPFYYQLDQKELIDHTDKLLRETNLPLYLYDIPALTKNSFELEITRELLSRNRVKGFKDSSGDMVRFQKLRELAQKSSTSLLIGPEELLMESLILGGHGGVPGGANVFPELYVSMYDAVKRENLQEAEQLQGRIMKFSQIVYSGNKKSSGRIINGIKCALNCLNICSDFIAKPLANADKTKAERIQKYIEKCNGR